MPLTSAPAVQQRVPAVPPMSLLVSNERRAGINFVEAKLRGEARLRTMIMNTSALDGGYDKEGIAPRHVGSLLP